MDARQQAALIELGQLALNAPEAASLLEQAAALVAETLGVPYCAVWESSLDQRTLLLRAGAGWREGSFGQVSLGATPLAEEMLRAASPVIAAGRGSSTPFDQIPMLRDHRVIAGLWVSIPGQARPFGALGAYSTTNRAFADGEPQFLQMAAHTLAMAMDRARAESSLRISEERFLRLAENATDITYRYSFAPTPHFDYVSPAATTITGYSPQEHYADPGLIFRLIHPDDRATIQVCLQGGALSHDVPVVRLIHKDGSLIWTEQRIVPVRDSQGCLVAIEGVVRNINKRKRLEAELAEAHRRLADSRETARLFLARELHDSAVQQLLGISYQLAGYRRHTPVLQHPGGAAEEEDVAETLMSVRQSILRVVQQIRLLIGELRPAGLEEFGLTTALKGYVSHLSREERQTSARISLDLVETGTDIPRLTGVCLFRVAQEALRNALKHATASHIYVSLCRSAGEIVLRVSDDGCGFQVPEQLSELALDDHFGLVGMAEWVASAQGELKILSQPGEGTEVEAVIPLPPRVSVASFTEGGAPES